LRLGQRLVAEVAAGESELTAVLGTWDLRPEQFRYPWDSYDPS
jgi:hypothetical protein